MNGTSYVIAKLLAVCGFSRKNKRLTDAGSESHLLRRAECMLGMDVWRDIEGIEALNVEYWTLRKLDQKKAELEASLGEANQVLELNSGQRTESLYDQKDECVLREKEQEVLIAELEILGENRDAIIAKAHLLRRKIEASRTKIEVIGDHAESSEVEKEKVLLSSYEQDFEKLKSARDRVGDKISKLSDEIMSVEDLIVQDRNALKDKASREFHSMGKANRDVTQIVSDLGLIDVEMQSHFEKIGNHLSFHNESNALCKKACSQHSREVNRMKLLRTSIARHHEIASMGS